MKHGIGYKLPWQRLMWRGMAVALLVSSGCGLPRNEKAVVLTEGADLDPGLPLGS